MPQVARHPPDDPREWLNRAKSNLATARAAKGVEGVYFEDVCFNAQQAAEKAIKAVLLSRHVDFPWVHDLAELLTLVRDSVGPLPREVADAVELTDYAVAGRYPGHGEPITEQECDEAIHRAETVVRWASDLIG